MSDLASPDPMMRSSRAPMSRPRGAEPPPSRPYLSARVSIPRTTPNAAQPWRPHRSRKARPPSPSTARPSPPTTSSSATSPPPPSPLSSSSTAARASPTTTSSRSSQCGMCAECANVTHLTLSSARKKGAQTSSVSKSCSPLSRSVGARMSGMRDVMSHSSSRPFLRLRAGGGRRRTQSVSQRSTAGDEGTSGAHMFVSTVSSSSGCLNE